MNGLNLFQILNESCAMEIAELETKAFLAGNGGSPRFSQVIKRGWLWESNGLMPKVTERVGFRPPQSNRVQGSGFERIEQVLHNRVDILVSQSRVAAFYWHHQRRVFTF